MQIVLPGYTARRVGAEEADLVQAILETDADYFARVEGTPMRPDEGRQLFDEYPPSVPPARKHVVVVDDVALLDFLEGYPEPSIWYLGLVFVVPRMRDTGFGTRLLAAFGAAVRQAGGTALRLAVMHGNPDARRLYDRLGFQLVAERTRTAWDGSTSPVDVLQLAL